MLSEKSTTKYIHKEDVKEIVGKVKKRKATDCQGWKNELVTQGGGEMIKSLLKVFNIVNETQELVTQGGGEMIKSLLKVFNIVNETQEVNKTQEPPTEWNEDQDHSQERSENKNEKQK